MKNNIKRSISCQSFFSLLSFEGFCSHGPCSNMWTIWSLGRFHGRWNFCMCKQILPALFAKVLQSPHYNEESRQHSFKAYIFCLKRSISPKNWNRWDWIKLNRILRYLILFWMRFNTKDLYLYYAWKLKFSKNWPINFFYSTLFYK